MNNRTLPLALALAFAAAPQLALADEYASHPEEERATGTSARDTLPPDPAPVDYQPNRMATGVNDVPARTDGDVLEQDFATLDTDRDGDLTRMELSASTTGFAGDFSDVDVNGDGKVSPAEWSRYRTAQRDSLSLREREEMRN